MDKKGFTLIELLAVIVILAVIALIVTPIVTNIISKAKLSADMRSAEAYVKAGEDYYARSELNSEYKINIGKNIIDKVEIAGSNNNGTLIVNNDGQVRIAIKINNKCYRKNIGTNDILTDDDIDNCIIYSESILNGADPEVSAGMIPITIEDDGTVKKANIGTSWYNYENKRWANIVLVNESSRDNYKKATPNTIINQSDILAYFVWIPRYKYQLFNAEGLEGTSPQEIQIEFENNNTSKSLGTINGEWLTAPGFTFGNKESNGIWVGKFETTGNADVPTVLPNQISLKVDNVSKQFGISQKFNNKNTYGINNDSHMAKNSEWGAIAYLTHSKYGRCNSGTCTEISINNSLEYVTGSSAGRPGDPTTATSPTYAYNTSNGYLASTTGNITGIYDMVGNAWEYVMGLFSNDLGSSGFTSLPDKKYFESYTLNQNILGEALLETRGWNSDYQIYVSSTNTWFKRGGGSGSNAFSGIFSFNTGVGFTGGYYYLFRPVLIS